VSQEGAAEKVYEAGIELVNPGGRPDVLRAAAKGWRWIAEMEEIAATFAAAGQPDGFHLAAAEVFASPPGAVRSSS